jgi:hypothetical protein
MGAGIFIIAILGCGEAEAPCERVRMLETRYESQAACAAATEAALQSNAEANYPVIVAECVAEGQTPRVTPAEVQLPEPPKIDPKTLPASPVRS